MSPYLLPAHLASFSVSGRMDTVHPTKMPSLARLVHEDEPIYGEVDTTCPFIPDTVYIT
jgi:hypothetical protein